MNIRETKFTINQIRFLLRKFIAVLNEELPTVCMLLGASGNNDGEKEEAQ